MKLPLLFSLALSPALLAMPSVVTAQNLLTVNTSFESNTPFIDNGGNPTTTYNNSIPGWSVTIAAGSFAGAAGYGAATNLDGSNAAYLGVGTNFTTLDGSRAPVTPGSFYMALGYARTDADPGVTSSGTLTLNFYDGNAPGSLLLGSFPTSSGTLPAKVSGTDAFNLVSIAGAAPAGAAFAGVSYTVDSGFQNIDNFQVTVPEPSTYVMSLGGIGLLLAARRFRGSVRV